MFVCVRTRARLRTGRASAHRLQPQPVASPAPAPRSERARARAADAPRAAGVCTHPPPRPRRSPPTPGSSTRGRFRRPAVPAPTHKLRQDPGTSCQARLGSQLTPTQRPRTPAIFDFPTNRRHTHNTQSAHTPRTPLYWPPPGFLPPHRYSTPRMHGDEQTPRTPTRTHPSVQRRPEINWQTHTLISRHNTVVVTVVIGRRSRRRTVWRWGGHTCVQPPRAWLARAAGHPAQHATAPTAPPRRRTGEAGTSHTGTTHTQALLTRTHTVSGTSAAASSPSANTHTLSSSNKIQAGITLSGVVPGDRTNTPLS
jgi:hypothetical protein